MKKDAIHAFLDDLQSSGRYYFFKKELLNRTGQGEKAANRSLIRLQEKKRVRLIRRGFYIIIPVEFRQSGILPPEWFIQNLMESLGVEYYVGLLSAAAIWGASHQKPQEFHILCPRQFRAIESGGLRVRFFLRRHFPGPEFMRKQKTETGFMQVSSAELTALDLLLYSKSIGGLGLVATTLAELGESIEPGRLLKLARKEKAFASLRRLGFMLDNSGYSSRTVELSRYIQRKRAAPILLDPSLPRAESRWIRKWNIFENLSVEADEL